MAFIIWPLVFIMSNHDPSYAFFLFREFLKIFSMRSHTCSLGKLWGNYSNIYNIWKVALHECDGGG